MALFCSAGMWNVFLKMTLYILYVNKQQKWAAIQCLLPAPTLSSGLNSAD